ncbi:hypothetical protein BJY01DRAFT_257975 [Aspergillus pseudoustus]|uniref:Aminoglycoside phosphotransferase domain-containing protein n=1 Tax=Aspergillus pseudoustus TaxID=1810923 RepID=A0ABR4JF43_9EURO
MIQGMYAALNWKGDQHLYQKEERDACLERIDWEELCAYASSLNDNRPCCLLDRWTAGGVHLIKLLEFAGTDTQWVARVQIEPSTAETTTILRAEIAAMELVHARAALGVPVPKIFGYELDDANPVRAAFMLMEFLPGSSAMDADGGYEVHRGQIQVERRSGFYHEMAHIQVHLSSIRLPTIGTVVKHPDGTFGVGPLPGLGGPFSTATEFFIASAKHAKFPLTDDQIRRCTEGGGWTEQILDSINAFPSRLRALARRISRCDNGPFPLYHPDLYQSNVIVDDSYQVLGVIDWEGACSVPWEVVQPPLFLNVLPRAMDDPDNYAVDGQPKNGDTLQRLADRDEYARYVRDAEHELKTDHSLSTTLLDPAVQGLAYAIKVYLDPGKMGFYCNVLEPFASG